jgi:Glyoxalase/Bleomycin resistance protein/Dioxygenase superfamily
LFAPHFQVGFVVPDIEDAMASMGAALGVSWCDVIDRELEDVTLRVTFARTAAPYLELIEALPGTLWAAPDGPAPHHIGYWCEDVQAESARYEAAGLPLRGDLGRIRYHGHADGKVLFELIETTVRDEFFARWQGLER